MRESRERTEMVSMTILMTAGAEKATVHSAIADLSSDPGGPEGNSFAKSFNERVAGSAVSQEKDARDEAVASSSVKSAPLAKKSAEVAVIPSAVKGQAITTQEMPAHSELKSVVAEKTGQPQKIVVAGEQEKTEPTSSETEKAQTSATEELSDDIPSGPRTSSVAPTAGLKDEGFVPSVSVADGDRLFVSSGDTALVPKETGDSGAAKESSSAKKTQKTQENSTTPKPLLKGIGAAVKSIASETQHAVGSSVQGAIPMPGELIAPAIAVQTEISKAPEVFSKAVPVVTKAPFEGISGTIDSSARKETVFEGNTNTANAATAATAATDPEVSPKAVAGTEKTAPVTIASEGDNENKAPGTPESIAPMLHSMTGGSGVSGIVQMAVVHGDTSSGLAVTKVTIPDAGSHIAGLPIGAREEEGPSTVEPSIDGSPRLLTTTPTALEVGIQSGTHGWLKVRAEMTDVGAVNASVSSSSSAGQEMLHRELPALTAYLQEEKVVVNAVVVHAPLAAGGEFRSSTAGADSSAGETPQRNNEGEQQRYMGKGTSDSTAETGSHQSLPGVDEGGSLPLAPNVSGRGWLSVRA
jgi:hypothetical protein